ncbi:hypothetical protein EVAR_79509_1 [Eumeta japonica]|uniref:Uncharacterized protein n=1 Tax=Eumeta variegata TaxID=151549 RepID=A0A4C1UE37_EUMVA|nr:hypothetical protein EVAR_79509_1 [Eumeta japonica]
MTTSVTDGLDQMVIFNLIQVKNRLIKWPVVMDLTQCPQSPRLCVAGEATDSHLEGLNLSGPEAPQPLHKRTSQTSNTSKAIPEKSPCPCPPSNYSKKLFSTLLARFQTLRI